jgi:quercetin dioxygenase-like cupin family protein
MFVRPFADAPAYKAPNHRGVTSLRLQGFEVAGGPTNQWVGLSRFAPGGGAGPDSTPFEKIYVVLSGEMTVIVDGRQTVLSKFDSCTRGGVRDDRCCPLSAWHRLTPHSHMKS